MIKKLYLKNFKGFKEAFLELEDVNFFVGENSTGKTTILKLINILSKPEFWFSAEFNNSEVELGYFEEILHKKADVNNFYIGIEQKLIEIKLKKDYRRRILFEFIENDSIPKISSIMITLDENLTVFASLKRKQIHYKVKKTKAIEFRDWVMDNDFPKTYRKINAAADSLPLTLLFSILSNSILKEKNTFKSFYNFSSLGRYTWLAPIRAKAKRTYESFKTKFSPEGDHIPTLLRNLLSKKRKGTDNLEKIKTLESFGRQSNLFDKIEVNELGKKHGSPFKINILYNKMPILLPNVGYGVSQVLPLIIEILSMKNHLFSVQQPEVHLHPKAQAAFGEFIYNSSKKDENSFLIETHSEFTINRFRYCLSRTKSKNKPQSQVVFFERDFNGTGLAMIKFDKNGSYHSTVPSAYRDFYIDEELKMLEM